MRYWVEFTYTVRVTGVVEAKNTKEIVKKIECGSRPDFDEFIEYTTRDPDIEIEGVERADG